MSWTPLGCFCALVPILPCNLLKIMEGNYCSCVALEKPLVKCEMRLLVHCREAGVDSIIYRMVD